MYRLRVVLAAEVVVKIAAADVDLATAKRAVTVAISKFGVYCRCAARIAINKFRHHVDGGADNWRAGFWEIRQNQPGIVGATTRMRELHFGIGVRRGIGVDGETRIDNRGWSRWNRRLDDGGPEAL